MSRRCARSPLSPARAADLAQMVPVARTVEFHVKRPLLARRQARVRNQTYREGRQAAAGAKLLLPASRKTMPGSFPGMPRFGGPRSEDRTVQR